MTHLRQIMLEELERRNYAPGTIRCYIRTVEHYAQHFRCSPDRLGPEHIRRYQALMFSRWKLAPNTVSQSLAALRFFYIQVLKRSWSVAETPYPKKLLHLPQVLSQAEVAQLIELRTVAASSCSSKRDRRRTRGKMVVRNRDSSRFHPQDRCARPPISFRRNPCVIKFYGPERADSPKECQPILA